MVDHAGEDYVQVRMTKEAAKLAGDAPLRVVSGRHIFEFLPGEPQRVTRALEWEAFLSQQHIDGVRLFELAPEEK